MTERVRRVRPATVQMTGRLAQALQRRRAPAEREETESVVQPFFGEDTDTPMVQLLREGKPSARLARSSELLHVSDVVSKCVRRIVLMERMGVRQPAERLADGQGITFAIGDALHAYITQRFIEGHPSKVYAAWGCACGATKKKGLFEKVSKRTCDDCGTALTKHHEISFPHPDLPLTGSPDLILYLDEYGAYFVTELKSMSGAQFKELTRPMPDHVIQVVFYWHILKACKLPLVDKVSIVYINKEFSFKNPYKEFLIDPQQEGLLEAYLEDIDSVVTARAGGALPVRSFCAKVDSPEAKKCPVAVSCFGCD